MSILEKGTRINKFRVYTDGYVLGTSQEPPYASMLMTEDITFGGFDPGYKIGSEGMLVFIQDATGGHEIDWDGTLVFVGTSGINLGANTVTVIDTLKTEIGWVGFVRSVQASVVTLINGLNGVVTLKADNIPIVDTDDLFTSTTVEGSLIEIANRLTLAESPTYVDVNAISFALLQEHKQKTIRQVYAVGDGKSILTLSRPNFIPGDLNPGSQFFITNFGTGLMSIVAAGDVIVNGFPLSVQPGNLSVLRFVSDDGAQITFDIISYGGIPPINNSTRGQRLSNDGQTTTWTSEYSFQQYIDLAMS